MVTEFRRNILVRFEIFIRGPIAILITGIMINSLKSAVPFI